MAANTGSPAVSDMKSEAGEANEAEGVFPDNLLIGIPDAPDAAGLSGREAASPESQAAGLTDEERKIVETVRKNLEASNLSGGFDMPLVLNDAVNLYIKYFSEKKRKVFARWLVRAQRYAPTIRSILKAHNMPEDLVYLSMIESGFNMRAYSPAKAKGPWQFIHETGERYGLHVGFWVDERCDLEKSTVAAARYLKELFDRFGCWYLAAAGYNAGEHRIEKAIVKNDTRDFWKLRRFKKLPRETQEYVPQLIAAALIAKDPEKYGFEGKPAASVDALTKVEVAGGLPLPRIARALAIDPAELSVLNPELTRGVTPPGKSYRITLPGVSDKDAVKRKINEEFEGGGQLLGVVKHSIKKKESLAGVLKRYNVSHSDFALVNEGTGGKRGVNKVVFIPRFASAKGAAVTAGDPHGQVVMQDADLDGEIVTLAHAKTKKSHGPAAAKASLTRHVAHKADRADRPKAAKKSHRTKTKRLAARR